MIVLGRHEDEGVELLDLCSPGLVVRLAVLTHGCRDRLIEQGQIEILYVHDFERCIAPLARDVIDPARATVSAFRPGRVLPMMMATFSISPVPFCEGAE